MAIEKFTHANCIPQKAACQLSTHHHLLLSRAGLMLSFLQRSLLLTAAGQF